MLMVGGEEGRVGALLKLWKSCNIPALSHTHPATLMAPLTMELGTPATAQTPIRPHLELGALTHRLACKLTWNFFLLGEISCRLPHSKFRLWW